jgi:hypothetical protein
VSLVALAASVGVFVADSYRGRRTPAPPGATDDDARAPG